MTGPELAQSVAMAASGGVIGRAQPPAGKVAESIKREPDTMPPAGFCEGSACLLSSRHGKAGTGDGTKRTGSGSHYGDPGPAVLSLYSYQSHGNLIDFVIIIFLLKLV